MKRKKIIEVGKELFWKHGIKKVSVEEICQEANVSKMTFYKYFQNKVELAQFILDTIIDKSLKDFESLVNSDLEFTEKVKRMFIIKLEASNDISIEFIKDMYKNPEFGLHLYMEKQGKQSMEIFNKFIQDSQKKGLIRKDVKIEFIIAYINQIREIMNDEKLMSNYKSPHDFILEMMNFLFYGMIDRNSKG